MTTADVETPRISVVTPSYNQGRFLDETMRSIHRQAYPNLEHIVIDGGSSDESVDIIKRYSDQLAYWVSEKDEGQTDALIKGFNRATGTIHCWLNSDDLFEPSTLQEVADFFLTHPHVRFIYGDSTWVDIDGRFLKPKTEHRWNRFVWMYHHNFIPQPSAFWRSDLYEEVGGLDPQFDFAMDADLWIRFADVTRPVHVKRPWSRMRFYAEQKNSKLRSFTVAEGQRIRSRYVNARSYRQRKARRLMATFLRVGLKAFAGGYSFSELRQHAGVLFGRGTWEEQQLKKSR